MINLLRTVICRPNAGRSVFRRNQAPYSKTSKKTPKPDASDLGDFLGR